MLKELHMGAQVQVIAKFSKHRYDVKRVGVKIRDLSSKKMLVAFGVIEIKVSYFNLTCSEIERAIDVIKVMTKENELPF